MNEVKCSCGAYYFATFWIYGYFDYQTRANYCATCGDKLNADGTVESRAEVDNILGHLQCAGCLHETQSDHHDPCTYCKRKHEDEYVKPKR